MNVQWGTLTVNGGSISLFRRQKTPVVWFISADQSRPFMPDIAQSLTGMFDTLSGKTDGERAVSPVIGVILMVAITVILAAVIASFVLGLGDTDDPAPTISFEDETTEDAFEISITSGDSDADSELLDVVVDDNSETWGNFSGADDTLGAGQSIDVNEDGQATSDDLTNESTVLLIWDDDDQIGSFDVGSEFDE